MKFVGWLWIFSGLKYKDCTICLWVTLTPSSDVYFRNGEINLTFGNSRTLRKLNLLCFSVFWSTILVWVHILNRYAELRLFILITSLPPLEMTLIYVWVPVQLKLGIDALLYLFHIYEFATCLPWTSVPGEGRSKPMGNLSCRQNTSECTIFTLQGDSTNWGSEEYQM